MSYDPDEPLRCPIADCSTRATEYGLWEHLEGEHDPGELVERLVQLAPDLPYHRDVECQVCQSGGARPGDHPLCEACEAEMGQLP